VYFSYIYIGIEKCKTSPFGLLDLQLVLYDIKINS
jgi:hypothetical protein